MIEKRSESKHINDKLYIARLNRHMSQQQVADAANLSRPYYTMIENGQVRGSVNTYHRLGAVLGYLKWKELIPDEYIDSSFSKESGKHRAKETRRQGRRNIYKSEEYIWLDEDVY